MTPFKNLLRGKDKKEEEGKKETPSTDILSQLRKIQEQLSYLERKVDQLLARSHGGRRHFRDRFRGRDTRSQEGRSGGEGAGKEILPGEDRKEERSYFMNKSNRNLPH